MSLGMIPTMLLSLSFLIVSTDSCNDGGRNLALGKPTTQISTLENDRDGIMYPGNSASAVDGNVLAVGINMTCTQTDYHFGETWWLVDLEDIYFITEVRILPFLVVRFHVVDVREGKWSRSRQIEAVQSTRVVTCSALCMSHEACTSFNMADEGKVCELMADPIGNEDVNEESTPG